MEECKKVKVNIWKKLRTGVSNPNIKSCYLWSKSTTDFWQSTPANDCDDDPVGEALIYKIWDLEQEIQKQDPEFKYNLPCSDYNYIKDKRLGGRRPCNVRIDSYDDNGNPKTISFVDCDKASVLTKKVQDLTEWIFEKFKHVLATNSKDLIGKTFSASWLINQAISTLYDIYGAPYTPFLLDTLTTARIRRFSPLILDLDGDGVEADGVTFFDHEGDGWNELTRWANEDDGLLVWDRNSDGVIDDGSELFGNNTDLVNGNKAEHGFAALAELDSNNDGVVDASDAKWSELRIMRWTDTNKDGMMQDNEKSLVTLESLGVTSLNTGFTNSDHVDAEGNEHRQVGSFTQTVEGSEVIRTMTDVWFRVNTRITTYDDSDIPAHSKAIEKLPDIAGNGRVYNLRDAMALDDATDENGDSLREMVEKRSQIAKFCGAC